ncbi:MAG: urease accessory protein UreD, partial [Halovenus sp.]
MAADDETHAGPERPIEEAGPPTESVDPAVAFEAYAAESLSQAAAGSTGKEGRLRLTFAADRDGNTRLVKDFSTVPFHLPGGLGHDEQLPDLATAYVQSPTGGIAQGDRHDVRVTVESDARAHVTTQSAEKVLGMERNCARTDVQLTVEDG